MPNIDRTLALWANRVRSAIALICLAVSAPAWAGDDDVCVDTVAKLVQALSDWEVQNVREEFNIKVVQGTYLVNGQLGDRFNFNGTGLRLLGGYTANCTSRVLNPANTVFDANNRTGSRLSLSIDSDSFVLVQGITFRRFAGGALQLGSSVGFTDEDSFLSVRHSRFVESTGNSIVSIEGARMGFVNNLVANNTVSGPGAAAVLLTHGYDLQSYDSVNNNTIASNSGGAGLLINSFDQPSSRTSEIANNIVWANGGTDIDLAAFDSQALSILVNYNIYGTLIGFTPPAGNLSQNPKFINPALGNFNLDLTSPAVNSGIGYQLYGIPELDLAGTTRIIGTKIDRGALESQFDDRATFIVTNGGDNGNNATPLAGSLRAGIKAANAASGPFQIRFAISGPCPKLLSLATPMLDVVGDVTIDAQTQPGWVENLDFGVFNANLCIAVNGIGATPYALHVPSTATNARLTVRGMMFAGFSDAAIKLEGGRDHRITGNQFGAVAFTVGNQRSVLVTGNSAGNTIIGGYDDPVAINLFASNTDAAIQLDNPGGQTTVANNVMGFQPDGLNPAANGSGIFVFQSPRNRIQYNYVSNNLGNAVTLSGTGTTQTTVQYNFINVDRYGVAGTTGGAGVQALFGANNNLIGSTFSANFGGNLIIEPAGPGVWISPSGGVGNQVLANYVFDAGSVDIDLGATGPSSNQPGNPASGPNHLQNYPVLAQAFVDEESLTIVGLLHSAASTVYRIDFYYDGACDGTAPGRGTVRYSAGHVYDATNAAGDLNFSYPLPVPQGLGVVASVSATATNEAGDTSEIGNCVPVTAAITDRIFADGFE